MAILDETKIVDPYDKKDATCYQKIMFPSDCIAMSDGTDLEERMIGMPYILQGTYVTNVSGTSCRLFDLKWLRENFKRQYGLSSTSNLTGRYCVLVMNGDGNANGFHVEGATWKGDVCYAVWKDSMTAHVRFNYVVFYLTNSNFHDD